MTEKKKFAGVSSCLLHILAMAFMLCDHAWSMLFMDLDVLTCIGRIAFPIFAFMLVEGYFHTKDIKKYLLRLLIAAVLSEIPFNLMYEGSVFYIFHQNVIWTFLLSLLLIMWIDRVSQKNRLWLTILAGAGITLLGFVLGYALMLDYYGPGVLTVLGFYIFHDRRKWWNYLGQFVIMYVVNVSLLGGYYYPVTVFGHYFELQQQALALLALIPIWLYKGRQGYHAKWFQYFCYGFYPVHMLVLYLLWKL